MTARQRIRLVLALGVVNLVLATAALGIGGVGLQERQAAARSPLATGPIAVLASPTPRASRSPAAPSASPVPPTPEPTDVVLEPTDEPAPTPVPTPTAEPTPGSIVIGGPARGVVPSPSAVAEPAGTDEPTTTPDPSGEPTGRPDPTARPAPTKAPTPQPTAAPTAKPTAKPTPRPTPRPSPSPEPARTKARPPCPEKGAPPPGKDKSTDATQPCGNGGGNDKSQGNGKSKGADGGFVLVLPALAAARLLGGPQRRARPVRRHRRP